MGWWYQDTQPKDLKEFFSTQFGTGERNGVFREIVDLALVNMREVYMAYRIKDIEKNEDKVIGIVILVDYARDGHFGYKDMDESMGPNYYNCPKRILDLLTPTEYEYAQEWRRLCYENADRAKLVKNLKHGQMIDLEYPLDFGKHYGKYRTFQVIKDKRKTFYWGWRNGVIPHTYFRITNLKDKNFVIVEDSKLMIDIIEPFAHKSFDDFIINNVAAHVYINQELSHKFDIEVFLKQMINKNVHHFISDILYQLIQDSVEVNRLIGGDFVIYHSEKTPAEIEKRINDKINGSLLRHVLLFVAKKQADTLIVSFFLNMDKFDVLLQEVKEKADLKAKEMH